jgi:hypothetical protein
VIGISFNLDVENKGWLGVITIRKEEGLANPRAG